MADVRFVRKSAPSSASESATKMANKMAGGLALVGALAGAGALFVWGCTDSSGSGKFVEPNRPFDAAAADGASTSGDAAVSDAAISDGAADHIAHADGANSDLGADR
jgi:hypothetical protein